jgi:hypothetical protein
MKMKMPLEDVIASIFREELERRRLSKRARRRANRAAAAQGAR